MKNKVLISLLAGLSAALSFSTLAFADVVKNDLPTRSKEQIKAKWKVYSPNQFQGDPYVEKPVLTVPYKAGRIDRAYLQGGVARANFYRYISGLPDDLELSQELSESTQHAAVVTAVTYGKYYRINDMPDDMKDGFYKIAYRLSDRSQFISVNEKTPNLFATAIDSYMDTSDMIAKEPIINEIATGAPMQILNPRLKKIGLGLAPGEGNKSYSALYLEDASRKEDFRYFFISYPSAGYFPADLFQDDRKWTILLNPSLFLQPKDLIIEIIRHSDQKIWTTEQRTLNIHRLFYDESSNTHRLMFSPHNLGAIKEEDTFTVRVTGLKKADGDEAELNYDVQFFYINRPASEQKPEPEKPAKTGNNSSKPESTGNPSSAKPDPSINPPVAETFTDMKGHWSEETVRWAARNKIIDGYPDGTFRPDTVVSEEEFLGMLLKSTGKLSDIASGGTWSDSLYEDALKHGLPVNGANDALARKAAITREKVAEIIAAATGFPVIKEEAVRYVLDKSFATGRTGADIAGYAGQEQLTRAESLQFIRNLHDHGKPAR